LGTLKTKPKVEIWTDGSVYPQNPGTGGWGVVLIYDHPDNTRTILQKNGTMEDGEVTKSDGTTVIGTTNNQAEAQALIEGIKLLNKPAIVNIITDSRYVEICYKKTMAGNLPNKNKEVWKEARKAVKNGKHVVSITRVKGHSNFRFNTMADKLAYAAATKQEPIEIREQHNGHKPTFEDI
jgi:ribonuclease HI